MKILTPSENTCVITEKPPELKTAKGERDFGVGSDPEKDCPDKWEVCLSRKAARFYMDLENYVEENYSKCQPKPPKPKS